MIFSQLALSFVLTVASTMAAGTAQFPKPPDRKLSKKKAALTPQSSVTGTNAIQGMYVYTNKCNNVFQATIECGSKFGDGVGVSDDLDLCLFSEYKIGDAGDAVPEDVTGDSEPLPGGGYFVPNDKLPSAGQLIDPDIVCVYSGTFRLSSAMDGPRFLKPIPLATSNGCPITTTNFQTVVKGMVQDDGNLELDFSSDYGVSYYTKDKPLNSYMGYKLADDILDRGRALARGDNGDGSMYHRHLVFMWLGFTVAELAVRYGIVLVISIAATCAGYTPDDMGGLY